ncbi:MAG: hypothetical protein U0Z53_24565 [Blastocatellia bacterium]
MKHILLITLPALALACLWLTLPSAGKTPLTAPLMFDAVHYYTPDREAATHFFRELFGARGMALAGKRPPGFIDLLSLRPGEGVISISAPGALPGVTANELKGHPPELMRTAPDLSPVYGPHWLGIRTAALNQALTELEVEGVRVSQRHLLLPGEIGVRAALIYGPDDSLIALVERRGAKGDTPFSLDHLQLLVRSLKENEQFFQRVYAARVLRRYPHTTVMKAADLTLVLSEPAALGLRDSEVQPRDARRLRPGISHLRFLFADVKAAVQAAQSKGVKFQLDGVRLNYDHEPLPYLLAVALSPDGWPCELVQEDGRTGPRTQYLN